MKMTSLGSSSPRSTSPSWMLRRNFLIGAAAAGMALGFLYFMTFAGHLILLKERLQCAVKPPAIEYLVHCFEWQAVKTYFT
jgi:hypothetical protein